MIVWRGWGVFAVVYTFFGFGVGVAIGMRQEADLGMLFGGIGTLIGSGFAFWHGWYINKISPMRKADEWEAHERVRLTQAAEQGQLVVDNVQPRTAHEADEMIERVIAEGRAQFQRLGFHSAFWIPMHWFAVVTAVIAVIIIVTRL